MQSCAIKILAGTCQANSGCPSAMAMFWCFFMQSFEERSDGTALTGIYDVCLQSSAAQPSSRPDALFWTTLPCEWGASDLMHMSAASYGWSQHPRYCRLHRTRQKSGTGRVVLRAGGARCATAKARFSVPGHVRCHLQYHPAYPSSE